MEKSEILKPTSFFLSSPTLTTNGESGTLTRMKTALAIGSLAVLGIAHVCHAQAPAKKPSLAEERMKNYQNSLNQAAKPGAESPAPASKGSTSEPVEGHVFALWELRELTDKLDGQVVRLKIRPTILRPDKLPSGDYVVFVRDAVKHAPNDEASFADIYFPAEGVQKMDLLRKTARGELSFWVSVTRDRYTAVGRTLKRDLNGALIGYVW